MKKMIITWILQCLMGIAYSQNLMVTGTVKDKAGEAIVGATVIVKGSNPVMGTATDMDGNFVLAVPDSSAVLEVKMMSYQTKFIKVGHLKTFNLVMETEITELQTVVTVGYGQIRKSDATGSVAVVDNNSVSRRSQSVDKLLQGSSSGVTITSSPLFKIRGVSSINNSSTVIYMQPSNTLPTDESYADVTENDFKDAQHNALSTFSIDVDKASYTNIRRMINLGQRPPADAVRVEEMINYFEYEYPEPEGEHPVAIYSELASCPWNSDHKILHIGLKGKEIQKENLPASNLVFLIDVSGSMYDACLLYTSWASEQVPHCPHRLRWRHDPLHGDWPPAS